MQCTFHLDTSYLYLFTIVVGNRCNTIVSIACNLYSAALHALQSCRPHLLPPGREDDGHVLQKLSSVRSYHALLVVAARCASYGSLAIQGFF